MARDCPSSACPGARARGSPRRSSPSSFRTGNSCGRCAPGARLGAANHFGIERKLCFLRGTLPRRAMNNNPKAPGGGAGGDEFRLRGSPAPLFFSPRHSQPRPTSQSPIQIAPSTCFCSTVQSIYYLSTIDTPQPFTLSIQKIFHLAK
jgi:hypothetical protein